jgi:hypothetical protein
VIKLFPNVAGWPKGRRRITMAIVWPLVFVESLLNCIVGFPVEFYRCWNVERYRNGQ